MQRLKFLLLIGLLGACDFFVPSEKKTRELVEKELQEIDWNDVDHYPLFENCDETWAKTSQRACFENEILAHCTKTLGEFDFSLDPSVDPVVQVDFLVDKDGKISVLEIKKDPKIDAQMPEFDRIISHVLKNMPALAPALKRGIPVKAKFRIKIALKNTP